MREPAPIHERSLGRWRSILHHLAIAVPAKASQHGPCPSCGGTDRFRFDDREGRGTFLCSQCGAGNGVDLVMRVKGCGFVDAVKMIEPILPDTVVITPRTERGVDPAIYRRMWESAETMDGFDPASWYLLGRGIKLDAWPRALRFAPRATYRHEDGHKSDHPAMLAWFTSSDGQGFTVHTTYLTSMGRKADHLPKPKRLAPMPIPAGGAVRLANSAETMGIAEGIETALSAMAMHDVPVWAALDANGLMKWEPPPTCRHVIVFGDHDTSFKGQLAAYSLAHRLSLAREHGERRFASIEVRIPGLMPVPDTLDTDWNDHHQAFRNGERMEAAE